MRTGLILSVIFLLPFLNAQTQVTVTDKESGKEININYTKPFFSNDYTVWGFAPLLNTEFLLGRNYTELLSMFVVTGYLEHHTSKNVVFGVMPRFNPTSYIEANEYLNKKTSLGLEIYGEIPFASNNRIAHRRSSLVEREASFQRRVYRIKHTPVNLTTIVGVCSGFDYFSTPVKLYHADAPVAMSMSAIKMGIYVARDMWFQLNQEVTKHTVKRFSIYALYAPSVKYRYLKSTGTMFNYLNTDSTVHNKLGYEVVCNIIPTGNQVGISCRFAYGMRPGQNFEILNLKTSYLRLEFFINFLREPTRFQMDE